MGILNTKLDDAIDEIDAAFFSGDSFDSEQAMKEIEYYIGRWKRRIEENRKYLAEEETNGK